MMQRNTLLATVALTVGMAQGINHAATLTSLTNDAQVGSSGGVGGTTAVTSRVGHDGGGQESFVAVFQLPTLPDNMEFSGLSTVFTARALRYNSEAYNGDLYGLGYRTSPDVLAADAYYGVLDATDATLIQDNFLDTSMSAAASFRSTPTGTTTLADYLNAQYEASAADRALGNTIYVFLRINPDGTGSSTYRYYTVDTADSTTANYRPKITYNAAPIPEPASVGLLGLALGSLALRRRHRQG